MDPTDRLALFSTLAWSLTTDFSNRELGWCGNQPDFHYASLLRDARSLFHTFMEEQGSGGLPFELHPAFMSHSLPLQYSFQALECNQRRGFSSADWLAYWVGEFSTLPRPTSTLSAAEPAEADRGGGSPAPARAKAPPAALLAALRRTSSTADLPPTFQGASSSADRPPTLQGASSTADPPPTFQGPSPTAVSPQLSRLRASPLPHLL